MLVKGKCLGDAQITHDHKAGAVSETEGLIGIFFKHHQSLIFLFRGNAEQFSKFLCVKLLGDLDRRGMS